MPQCEPFVFTAASTLLKATVKPKGEGMKTFRTLDLAIEFYNKAEQTKLTGKLKDQLLRASSSISLNLSEGNAKRTVKEKKRYYQMAYASVQECKTIFKLARIEDTTSDAADKLGAYIFNLLKSEIKTLEFKS